MNDEFIEKIKIYKKDKKRLGMISIDNNIGDITCKNESNDIRDDIPINNRSNILEKDEIDKDSIFDFELMDKLIVDYYSHELEYFPKAIKNKKINVDIKKINSCIHNKHLYNATIIFHFYKIYNKFLHDNKNNLKFEVFLEYNRNKYVKIETTSWRLKDKFKKCYYFLHSIENIDKDKDKIILFISKFKLTFIKIYKLREDLLYKLKDFLINELNNNQKYIDYNVNIGDSIFNLNLENIEELIKDIPFSYIGNKKMVIHKILYIITQIKKPINNFVDMFSGSLLVSYILYNTCENINIECYENNILLINFYNFIKKDVNKFIVDYINIINELKEEQNIYDYIKNIANNIYNLNDNNKQGLYYFLLVNLSFYNIINYTKKGISITIDKRILNRLIKEDINTENLKEKLNKYSKFLNNIIIHNIDIKKNYDKIFNGFKEDTLIYLDPPYDDNQSNKIYFGTFNKINHVNLKQKLDTLYLTNTVFIQSNIDNDFIKNLYKNYNIDKIQIEGKINKNKIRDELLITNFNYNKN